MMSDYFDELCRAMAILSYDPKVVFLGQAVACEGTAMSRTFRDVPKNQLLEFPVAEDFQLGFAIGLALQGMKPVCCYPRWNFALLALNQLVLSLDKLPMMTRWEVCPKVIVRTAIAHDQPMDPGPQHLGNFTDAVASMLRTVNVVRIDHDSQVVPAYEAAMESKRASLMVEWSGRY